MKQLYYVIQTLMHGRGANAVKIVSLGLGLTMSILLFSRIAYEKSFDTCFAEHENLYQLWAQFTINGEKNKPQEMTLGPMAGAVRTYFPDQIEAATSLSKWVVDDPLYYGDTEFLTPSVIAADSLFFETLGIEVLEGNPVQDLQQQDVIYLSESLARRIFADEEAVGKMINYNKRQFVTVKGVYRDIPDNSTLHPSAVISLPSVWNRRMGNYSWDGGDSWHAYLRVKPGTDVEDLNRRIDQLVREQHPEENGVFVTCMLKPIRDTYQGYEQVQLVIRILAVLGCAILFITALNYALISLSSISRRAKAIGVHKCNGASASGILGMFLMETALIILTALLLMAFIVLNFQDFVEETASTRLVNLFAWERIWVPVCVTAVLFVVGGVLPGILFARIPVTQVFKRYTEGKKGWKRPLLFVQFAGVAFIGGLMGLIMMQYDYVINKEVGYNPMRMAYGYHTLQTLEDYDANYDFYHSLPYVDGITCSYSDPLSGYSGEFVRNESGQSLFSTRYDFTNDRYAELMGMTFVEGHAPGRGEVAVNETFVKQMKWGKEAVGRQINMYGRNYKVSGVLKDFTIGSYLEPSMPYLMYYNPDKMGYCVYLRLKEPFADNLKRLNKDLAEAFPHKRVEFRSMEQDIVRKYDDVRILRNATMVAAVVILFITLMGLIGYVNDETQRRSKEIAIRKVNGAEASDILRLLALDVCWTALPAVLLGTLASWYVGEVWMSQFSATIGSTLPYYILSGLATLVLIVACVTVKTWRIANENPVVSIKSE